MSRFTLRKSSPRQGLRLCTLLTCCFGMLHLPVAADDNGVLTNKKSLLQAPVADVRLAELKTALATGDVKQVAKFFHFPLNVMTKTIDGELKLVQVANTADFAQQYAQLLSPMQQQFLRCLTPMQLSFDGFDYSALAGQFWLRDFSQAGKRDFYISTLSQDPAVLAPWLSANCQDVSMPASDELGVIEARAPVTAIAAVNPSVVALQSFSGVTEQHRLEISELSSGKWRYRSWLLTQTDDKPALEIIGAKVLDGKGPVLQFRRGKYRYRFVGPQSEAVVGGQSSAAQSRLEIYYNESLLRTELISRQ